MGYQETVFGFGKNHMRVNLRLMFKKVTINGNEVSLDQSLEDLEEAGYMMANYIATIQDDVYFLHAPDTTEFKLDSIDAFSELFNNNLISREYGLSFIQSEYCFVGICLFRSDDDENDGVSFSDDLLKEINTAKQWMSELQAENRFPQDVKLMIQKNCCS